MGAPGGDSTRLGFQQHAESRTRTPSPGGPADQMRRSPRRSWVRRTNRRSHDPFHPRRGTPAHTAAVTRAVVVARRNRRRDGSKCNASSGSVPASATRCVIGDDISATEKPSSSSPVCRARSRRSPPKRSRPQCDQAQRGARGLSQAMAVSNHWGFEPRQGPRSSRNARRAKHRRRSESRKDLPLRRGWPVVPPSVGIARSASSALSCIDRAASQDARPPAAPRFSASRHHAWAPPGKLFGHPRQPCKLLSCRTSSDDASRTPRTSQGPGYQKRRLRR